MWVDTDIREMLLLLRLLPAAEGIAASIRGNPDEIFVFSLLQNLRLNYSSGPQESVTCKLTS